MFSRPLDVLALPETVTVVRKKKEKVLTVADYVVSAPAQEPLPAGEGARVVFTLRSRDTGSLRPDLVAQELLRANPGTELQTITRTAQRAR